MSESQQTQDPKNPKLEDLKKTQSVSSDSNEPDSTNSKTKTLDENLQPLITEIEGIKDEFQKKIKTPVGIKVLSAIFTGLLLGVLIWITMGILTLSVSPSVPAWIVGVVVAQVIDSLTGYIERLQKIFAKLLQ